MSYKTKHFKLAELVNPSIIAELGEINSWLRLDEGCLRDLDKIRELWGSQIIINLPSRQNAGVRPYTTGIGAKYSTHKNWNTFDLKAGNGKHWELWMFVHKLIKERVLSSFNTLEDRKHTPSWVHVAKMNTLEKPLVIKP